MKNRIKFFPLFATLLSATLLLGWGTVHAKEVSGPAPDFTLPDSQGNPMSLKDFRGEVVMINFWASWCIPCRQEMPFLEKLYQRYKDLGFTIIGINVEEDTQMAHAMLKKIPVSFPILFDQKNDVSKLYQVSGMPTTILIDKDGNKRFEHKGYMPGIEEKYKKQVKALIRE